MEENKQRGQWGSTFGFLMASIGSAIGLGNLWGFPYKMGSTGGFAFLLVYLVLVILIGRFLMMGEFALGRKTG
ncbi:MAG: sodium-dependent transporter, partial [Ruminiclostridium sp.]|nr:sodium-dependent transporter [Ruminiclostridium sp.]